MAAVAEVAGVVRPVHFLVAFPASQGYPAFRESRVELEEIPEYR